MAQSESRKLGLSVSAEMADKLKELSERTMIPQSKLLRQALEMLFDRYAEGSRTTGKAKRSGE